MKQIFILLLVLCGLNTSAQETKTKLYVIQLDNQPVSTLEYLVTNSGKIEAITKLRYDTKLNTLYVICLADKIPTIEDLLLLLSKGVPGNRPSLVISDGSSSQTEQKIAENGDLRKFK